jgi:polyisoprenoid-binding protein YceI
MITRTATVLLALAIGGWTSAEAAPCAPRPIDVARSEVRFTVTKLGYQDVTGRFTAFAVSLCHDPAHPESSTVRWATNVASVVTGESGRDSSLQQPEYFDARNHPQLTFTSSAVRARPDGSLEVSGTITMRGISRALTFIARPVQIDGRSAFETDFTINRYDFDVRGGTVMGRLIGRTVRVYLRAVLH